MSRVSYDRPLSVVGFRPYRHTTPFSAAHGLGYLGDDAATLAQHGFSSAQISEIIAAHNSGSLSDNGYLFSLQGGVPADQLDQFLAQDPGASESAAAAAASAPSQAAGVPSGSIVTYKGTWQTSTTKNANDILNAVLASLPKDGVNVLSSSSTAGMIANTKLVGFAESGINFDVTLQLQPIGAFGQARDLASIVDHEVWVVSGKMPQGSGAAVTSMPGAGGAGSGLPVAADFTTWIEQNAIWIALGIGAIFILPKVLK